MCRLIPLCSLPCILYQSVGDGSAIKESPLADRGTGDHSVFPSWRKLSLTSRWAARSSTRCCRAGWSRRSPSGRGGWHSGRHWGSLNERCRCSTTSQNTYRSSSTRRKSSPKNWMNAGSSEKDSELSLATAYKNTAHTFLQAAYLGLGCKGMSHKD